MEISQIRHFVTAARSNNYTQAAAKCFTSRQNIAYSIKSLEKDLGVVLFRREKNDMVLTPEGREALLSAEEILQKIQNFEASFSTKIDKKQQIKIAVSSNLFTGIPSSIHPFIADRNAKDITIYEQECQICYENVCNNAVDMALVMAMDRDFAGCEAINVAKSPAYALVSKHSKLATLSNITPYDLLSSKILIMSQPDFQYQPLFKRFTDLNYDMNNISVIASSSSMMLWVRTGESIAIVSKKFAHPAPKDTVAVPFADSAFDWHFYVLYSKNCSSPKTIMDMAADIKEHFRSDARCGEVIST